MRANQLLDRFARQLQEIGFDPVREFGAQIDIQLSDINRPFIRTPQVIKAIALRDLLANDVVAQHFARAIFQRDALTTTFDLGGVFIQGIDHLQVGILLGIAGPELLALNANHRGGSLGETVFAITGVIAVRRNHIPAILEVHFELLRIGQVFVVADDFQRLRIDRAKVRKEGLPDLRVFAERFRRGRGEQEGHKQCSDCSRDISQRA